MYVPSCYQKAILVTGFPPSRQAVPKTLNDDYPPTHFCFQMLTFSTHGVQQMSVQIAIVLSLHNLACIIMKSELFNRASVEAKVTVSSYNIFSF